MPRPASRLISKSHDPVRLRAEIFSTLQKICRKLREMQTSPRVARVYRQVEGEMARLSRNPAPRAKSN